MKPLHRFETDMAMPLMGRIKGATQQSDAARRKKTQPDAQGRT